MTLEDAKDRQLAQESLDSSLFIEAGAGTGKSTTLVDRIIATIQRPEPTIEIADIAAITFTQRAGAELRNKLREGLTAALINEPENTRIQTALENLDAARVGTIHSLAQNILREHAISAGIPIGFEVASDSDSAAALQSRARVSVEKFLNSLSEPSKQILRGYGISLADLRKLMTEVDKQSMRLSDAAFEVNDTGTAQQQAELLAELESFGRKIEDEVLDKEDKLFVKLEGILPRLIDLVRGANLAEMAQTFVDMSKKTELAMPPLGNNGSAKNWSDTPPKEIRAEFRDFLDQYVNFLFAPCEAVIREGLQAVRESLKRARNERAKNGQLEYDDLMSLTAELLESNTQVRNYVHGQFKVVMVDEFQDTDPLQWRIVRMITADPSDVLHRPLPGRLVVVGDPKQAIYSFRGADIDTYQETLEQFTPDGEDLGKIVTLTTNFRSVAPVIEVVNNIFSTAMADTIDKQVPYCHLVAAHTPTAPNPGPAILVVRDPQLDLDPDGKPRKKYSSREMEPKQLAFAITTAIADKWLITKPNDSRGRDYGPAAHYSDITILYPSRTGVPALLDALDDYAIPYRSADAGLVYDRPVILGLKAALTTAVENQADLNLWLALKSPLFGCSDTDLLQHRLAGLPWYATEEAPAGIVQDSLETLKSLRNRSTRETPVELIDFLLDRTRILEVLPKSVRGNFEADCIRMVKAHAQAWQDQGGVGLYEYLKWIEAVLKDSTKTSLPEPDDREDNAVRLMTIHQAKGLEFPIVVLSGMAIKVNTIKATVGTLSASEFEFTFSGAKTSRGYSSWYDNESVPRKRAELIRLMYVALTRSQDHVILSLAGETNRFKKDGELQKLLPYSDLLCDFVPPSDTDITIIPDNPIHLQARPKGLLPPLDPTWIEGLTNIRESTKTRWVSSPSGEGAQALIIELTEPSTETDQVEAKTEPVERQMRDGTAIGQSVHRSLDVLIHDTNPTAERIQVVCTQIAAEEEASSHPDLIVAMVQHGLNSDTVKVAITSGEFWSEMYVAAPVEHDSVQVVDGLIDLTYRDANGLHIIDYKTDQVITDDTMKHYRKQLLSYAELVKRATGTAQVSAQILHLTAVGSAVIQIT